MIRKVETFPPVTMAHIRGHCCRDLLIYCSSGHCHHSATMNGDWLATGHAAYQRDDEVAALSFFLASSA